MKATTVIIGGGVAGLSSAVKLAEYGRSSIIIEAAPYLGGQVSGYSCKALDTCQRCGACLLEEILERLTEYKDLITVLTRAEVKESAEGDGIIRLNILQRAQAIHPDLCQDCGKCLQVCPEPNVLRRSPIDQSVTLDSRECLAYKDGECKACVDACPEDAINLDDQPLEIEISASTVIIATGFKPFDPSEKPRYGYGLVKGVITSKELDERLRDGSFAPSNGDEPFKVAFIQCVGSRDTRIDKNYCSQVCCGYAMRMGRLLKKRFPSTQVTMFYMDIQTYDRDFENRLNEASKDIRLIRAAVSEIRTDESDRPLISFHGPESVTVPESFDIVVLSVGMSPETRLADTFGLDIGPEGFLTSATLNLPSNSNGVFVAGAAKGPVSIVQAVEDGISAARAMNSHIMKTKGEV